MPVGCRFQDESKQCDTKDKEIIRLRQLVDAKTKEEAAVAAELAKNRIYQDYLQNVVAEAQATSVEGFHEIQDILDRYNTLRSTNVDLLRKQKQISEEHEQRRSTYLQFIKVCNDDMLNDNNEIASLQKNLDQASIGWNPTAYLDDEDHTRSTMQQTAELGRILAAIDYIVERFEKQAQLSERDQGNGATRQRNTLPAPNVSSNSENVACTAASEGMTNSLQDHRIKALNHLDKIADYMLDYKSIVDEWAN